MSYYVHTVGKVSDNLNQIYNMQSLWLPSLRQIQTDNYWTLNKLNLKTYQ